MAAETPLDSVKKSLVDSDVLKRECDGCESDLVALKVAWEQFFLGIERRPPTQLYEDFKKRLARLKNQFTRVTGLKFRINTLHQKFLSYDRLWQRTLNEMEQGTYKRDIFKAKMHARKEEFEAKAKEARQKKKDDNFDITEDLGDMGLDDELDQAASAKPPPPPAKPALPSVAAVAPLVPGLTPAAGSAKSAAVPARPAAPSQPVPRAAAPTAAVRPPMPASASSEGMSDAKVKAIYDAYVTAKRRCAEDTSKITLESVAATLKKQVPELMKKHNAKGVDFKVVIKDGKALLRAVPKE